MDLEYQEQLIEYKIHELNLLINDFVNKLKINNRKEKRKIYNKSYYINKINKNIKLFYFIMYYNI
jgi:hypothetical protein